MSYIKFDKVQLINLEYSLGKELLRSNRAGSYSSTTIIGCNTRKYHGLLVTRQPNIDDDHHVLLSTIDETVIQHDESFNFGIHKYQGGQYNPKGHKYIRDFVTEPIPKILFRVGGVFLTKEMLYTHNDDRVIIKYTLEDANSPTIVRLKPFLAFRNRHALSKANHFVDTRYKSAKNGICVQMYEGYSPLFIQISKKTEYVHVPDWYYNIEYQEDLERGYDHLEDLFVPGYLEFSIKKGESVYLSAGLNELDPKKLESLYKEEIKKRTPRDNFVNCLINSAHQFIVERDGKSEVIAGFPWYGMHGRDTFVALPGLCLIDNRIKQFKAVLNSMIKEMQGPFFPEKGDGAHAIYGNAADNSLWFFWSLQQLASIPGQKETIWKEFGEVMKTILKAYRDGFSPDIKLNADGLLETGNPYKAMSWMDAYKNDIPITPRNGLAVEINALWYNAICFATELAKDQGDKAFVREWKELAEKIPESFTNTFWDEQHAYLADCVNDNKRDWKVRPNQVMAAALDYSPIDEDKQKKLLDKLKSELVTPRGLRSLSPKDPDYKGLYIGNASDRDTAAYNGTVWPWLLSFYATAYLKTHGQSGMNSIKKLYADFEPVMWEHGIGSVSEVYNGDPPHYYGGATSMAWSVASLLSIHRMINLVTKD
ncbi:MAG: amylo-alpha-1,6-glucosidase [Bacteroidota bacterium]